MIGIEILSIGFLVILAGISTFLFLKSRGEIRQKDILIKKWQSQYHEFEKERDDLTNQLTNISNIQNQEDIEQKLQMLSSDYKKSNLVIESLQQKQKLRKKELEQMQLQIKDYKKTLDKLENQKETTNKTPQPIQKKESIIEKQPKEKKETDNLVSLKKQLQTINSAYEKTKLDLEEYNSKCASLKSKNDLLEQENQFLQKNQVISNPDSCIEPRAQKIHPLILENVSKYSAGIFAVEGNKNILFYGGDYKKVLEQLINCSNITAHLQDSHNQNLQQYDKWIQNYIRDLRSSFYNMSVVPEELSEICTRKFAQCFRKHFLEKLIPSIYEGYKTEESIYENLVKEINYYVSQNGMITKMVKNGETYDNRFDMQVSKKNTDIIFLHNVIEEVQLLPYYIWYFDKDGNSQQLLIKQGRCSVYTLTNED